MVKSISFGAAKEIVRIQKRVISETAQCSESSVTQEQEGEIDRVKATMKRALEMMLKERLSSDQGYLNSYFRFSIPRTMSSLP